MNRILLAVDDSPAGLAAARAAITLAVDTHAQVRVVHVLTDGEIDRALASRHDDADFAVGRVHAAEAVLRYVTDRAAEAGLAVETRILRGKPARTILAEASAWHADVVVLGRAGGRHVGEHYVGSAVQRVLEFSDIPVLVVPA